MLSISWCGIISSCYRTARMYVKVYPTLCMYELLPMQYVGYCVVAVG